MRPNAPEAGSPEGISDLSEAISQPLGHWRVRYNGTLLFAQYFLYEQRCDGEGGQYYRVVELYVCATIVFRYF